MKTQKTYEPTREEIMPIFLWNKAKEISLGIGIISIVLLLIFFVLPFLGSMTDRIFTKGFDWSGYECSSFLEISIYENKVFSHCSKPAAIFGGFLVFISLVLLFGTLYGVIRDWLQSNWEKARREVIARKQLEKK